MVKATLAGRGGMYDGFESHTRHLQLPSCQVIPCPCIMYGYTESLSLAENLVAVNCDIHQFRKWDQNASNRSSSCLLALEDMGFSFNCA